MKTIAVFTTIDDAAAARAIATALVERKLAACVQISEIQSVYTWQGATQNDKELRLVAKTVADRYTQVEATIRELHTYDLPAICAFGMHEVFPPYAEWVAENSTGGED